MVFTFLQVQAVDVDGPNIFNYSIVSNPLGMFSTSDEGDIFVNSLLRVGTFVLKLSVNNEGSTADDITRVQINVEEGYTKNSNCELLLASLERSIDESKVAKDVTFVTLSNYVSSNFTSSKKNFIY